MHSVHRHYGVADGRYKLIHFYQIGEWEFYDLERDPDEVRNAIDDPAYAQEIERLRVEWARLREEYRVPEDDD